MKFLNRDVGHSQAAQSPRRLARRYPVEVDIDYQLLEGGLIVGRGKGRTLNMSSGGVLIATEQPLPPSVDIQLVVAWPVKLDEVVPLSLHLRGRTLRSVGHRTAIAIKRHEFRTQPIQR